ncbi:MAG: CoA-transferase [Armatimonadota bacterium]|nr:CoA-transferase [Armatimonadota bacterium]MDR7534637.1 CoA-transferase [Armatimonadota bacterium]
MTRAFSAGELMVAAAAREIHDGDVVFVGMRLPLIAFQLAKLTHAPRAVGVFENGIVRLTPSSELLYTMSDPPNIVGASMCTRLTVAMSLLGRGRVDVGFIGGAEVDRFGNVNSSYIGPRERPRVKLPGSGGACDIASLARRLLIIMAHERHRFRQAVDFVTSPGYLKGGGQRRALGLPGGPAALITTLGVFGFDPESGEAVLRFRHLGVSLDEIRAQTGWELAVAPDLAETPPPTPEELRLIRQLDPEGFWTRGGG